MFVNQRSSNPRTLFDEDRRPDAASPLVQQRSDRTGHATGSPLRPDTSGRNQAARHASTSTKRPDNLKLIADLKRMLATSQLEVWNRSSDTIRGSIEYDLGHDRRPLDAAAENVNSAASRLKDAEHQMTAGTDPFSGIPWPADYKAYEAAKRDLERAKREQDDAQSSWSEASRKHLVNARPYAGEALTLDSSNHLVDRNDVNHTNWIVSATDARAIFTQAAQHAAEKIDAQLGHAWEQLVLDLRAWREKYIGKIDAETIDRQLNKASETYLLLEQDARTKKGIIDMRVKNFNDSLDGNQVAVIARSGTDDAEGKSAVVDLLRERRASLESAIADVNDQGKLAASLMEATVNNSRLATPRTHETPFVSESAYRGSPHDYAAKLSFYDTSTGKDVLIGTKDLGTTTIAGPKGDTAMVIPPDSIAPPPLTPQGTTLKLVYSYERLGASSYPHENGIAFATQQTNAQKQAEKDFTKYGGPVAGLVRAGEYGYVRFNNSQFVKDKLPALARFQKPMMPFNQPIPATVQFATRGVSIAADFTRGAMYLESAANKVARGEDPTSDYVAAGAAFAQGTIDSSVGLYVDAALVSASEYKAMNPEAKLPGKTARPMFPKSSVEPARGISYEYRPDGTIETAQRIAPDTGELQTYTPAREEFAMRDMTGEPLPSTSGTIASDGPSPKPVALATAACPDAEIQSEIRASAGSIVQSAERVARAYRPLNTHGLPNIDTARARLNALATELRENADRLRHSFQKFAFDVELNRANELGGKKWSIPGGVKLMAYASAGMIVPALVEYGVKLSAYIDKANEGKVTDVDNVGLAASTTSTAAMITPYIPVVGPVVTPFLLIAGMVMNALAGSLDKTPVQKVSAQLRSQTAHSLANLGGYDPIVQPAPQA
jgi:hypothetical protein